MHNFLKVYKVLHVGLVVHNSQIRFKVMHMGVVVLAPKEGTKSYTSRGYAKHNLGKRARSQCMSGLYRQNTQSSR